MGLADDELLLTTDTGDEMRPDPYGGPNIRFHEDYFYTVRADELKWVVCQRHLDRLFEGLPVPGFFVFVPPDVREAERSAEIPPHPAAAAERVARLDWRSLEHVVGGLLRAQEYEDVVVTSAQADGGVDVVARAPGGRRTLVQIKHWGGRVSPAEIQKLRGSLAKGNQGLFITSGSFTGGARAEAARTDTPYPPIALVDGSELARLLAAHDVPVPNLDASED